MEKITKEKILGIISNTGKISKYKLSSSTMNPKSEIFSSEENLFNYMIENNMAVDESRTNSVCERCGSETKFKNLVDGYKHLCKGCQRKQTCLEKYGDATYNNSNKMLQTKIENDSYTQMVATHKATCLNKFGVEHHWLVDEIQDKKKENFIRKYGVDNPLKVKEVLDKVKSTCLDKYGVENPSYNQEVKDKIRDAQLNLTEDEKLIKESKRQETCLLKYGVTHQMQTGLYSSSGYKWKEYQMPSGDLAKIQGHEHYLLDELLLEYSEEEIITERRNMPNLWYIGLDEKRHRYFPDVFIPKTNTIYEVKSNWTLNLDLETNNLKFQAVKDAGYNFVLKIY